MRNLPLKKAELFLKKINSSLLKFSFMKIQNSCFFEKIKYAKRVTFFQNLEKKKFMNINYFFRLSQKNTPNKIGGAWINLVMELLKIIIFY